VRGILLWRGVSSNGGAAYDGKSMTRTLTLNMPDELYVKLVARAAAEKKSLNDLCLELLTASLDVDLHKNQKRE
jgi:predicted HicB family RNase H-like nuclease